VDADEPGAATDAEGVVLLLQAATTRMAAAMRAPRRLSSLSISLLLPVAVGGRPARLMDEFLLLVARRARPARPDDDAFHVVARPISPDVRPAEFDRRALER